MNNVKIAAAVALALGCTMGSHAALASPSVATCATALTTGAALFVAGSSAAQPSFATALANDLFDSTGETTISAPTVAGSADGNFKAYCGLAKSGNGAGIPAGTVTTVYYRAEGGSVVGALPIVNSKPVKMLDISTTACQVTNPSVVGLSATVGTTDGWTGCVTNHAVEMGVTDLEPTVFVAPNYPSAYSTAVFGPTVTKAALAKLTSTPLFQQVFGLFVNTSGINGGGVGQAIDLSRDTVAAILEGNYTDWSQVPTSTGGTVSNVSAPITLVNREAGSGTRTGATIEFLNTNCSSVTTPALSDPGPDGYATGDVLATAASTAGAITYASIDNNGKQANLSMATINGVKPSNLAATSGTYGWWFEATAQKGAGFSNSSGNAIYTWLVSGELANLASAPHALDINVIPTAGTNSAAVPVTGASTSSTVGGVTIYVNPFTKSGNSCSIPAEQN